MVAKTQNVEYIQEIENVAMNSAVLPEATKKAHNMFYGQPSNSLTTTVSNGIGLIHVTIKRQFFYMYPLTGRGIIHTICSTGWQSNRP